MGFEALVQLRGPDMERPPPRNGQAREARCPATQPLRRRLGSADDANPAPPPMDSQLPDRQSAPCRSRFIPSEDNAGTRTWERRSPGSNCRSWLVQPCNTPKCPGDNPQPLSLPRGETGTVLVANPVGLQGTSARSGATLERAIN